MSAIEPFRVSIPDPVIDDLRRRLGATRWPNEPTSRPWQFGTDLTWMRDVATYWKDRYDWRASEARLNAFTHFRAEIDGRKVHFIREIGSGDNPMPLILTHGWPGSIVEFLDVIDPLAHPERHGGDERNAFTVIVPSLPGYGFSDDPEGPIAAAEIAVLWSRLMSDVLGYETYVAQGGDWGGIVTGHLGLLQPQGLAAIHLNIAALQPADDPNVPLTPAEVDWKRDDAARRSDLMGYRWIQGTRPQTLAYGLMDSPVGLAAWILEKFHDWTIRGSPAAPPFSIDTLLTNVMLYWLHGINPANWMYVSLLDANARTIPKGRRVAVPTGFLFAPKDLGLAPPDSWLARGFDVRHRTDAPTGGHFFALECPQMFVDDVRAFFAGYR